MLRTVVGSGLEMFDQSIILAFFLKREFKLRVVVVKRWELKPGYLPVEAQNLRVVNLTGCV